jgi:hypothetical protein
MTKPEKDTFRVDGVTADGALVGVRRRGSKETPGTLHAFVQGRPLPGNGEFVKATRRPGSNELELEDLEEVSVSGKGPAKVSTNAYRKGFDRVFGKSNKDLN